MSSTAAAPAESSTMKMEALFRLTTRFRDLYPNLYLPESWTELELLPGLTFENVLATGVTWEEFLRFLWDKVVWMTPDIYIHSQRFGGGDEPIVFLLGVPVVEKKIFVRVTWGTPAAVATATCDFLVRLLATSEQHDFLIEGRQNEVPPPLSGAGLSLFFQESRDSLREVTLMHMVLSAEQCLALATMTRLDMELEIRYCSLADDAAGAFVECLQSDRGPVELSTCNIDRHVLATALTGASRVTKLKLDSRRTNDADMAVVFAALANNSGLVELDLQHCNMSDVNWSILCESLKAHHTLTCLDLRLAIPRNPTGRGNGLTDDQKLHRTRLLAEMVQHNTVLHTIQLVSENERDEEIYTGLLADMVHRNTILHTVTLGNERDPQIYTEEILSRLETNLYRPRVLAVKKTKEITFREKVLGRALFSVNSSPNLVWMFLSENVDAFARTEEEHETTSIEVPAVVVSAAAVAGTKRKL
jgi:hypothetical protein